MNGFIIFYLIGCIIAYQINKDTVTLYPAANNKSDNIKTILLSWITVAKYLYDTYINK